MTILQKLMTSLRFLPFKSSPKTHGLIFTSWVSEKKNGVIPKHVPIGRTDRPKFIRPFQPRSRVQNVRKKPSSFPADIIYEFMRIRHRMGAKLRNIFEYFLHWNNTKKMDCFMDRENEIQIAWLEHVLCNAIFLEKDQIFGISLSLARLNLLSLR